jgi:hypothetical protein
VTATELVGVVTAAGLHRFDAASLSSEGRQERLRELLAVYGCSSLDYVQAVYAVRRGRASEWVPWGERWYR